MTMSNRHRLARARWRPARIRTLACRDPPPDLSSSAGVCSKPGTAGFRDWCRTNQKCDSKLFGDIEVNGDIRYARIEEPLSHAAGLPSHFLINRNSSNRTKLGMDAAPLVSHVPKTLHQPDPYCLAGLVQTTYAITVHTSD